MAKKEIISPTESEIISRELIVSKIQQIAKEREKPGTSAVLIPQIRNLRAEAISQKEHNLVIQLYQEEFLSAQHMVMEERSTGLKNSVKLRLANGLYIMEKSINGMGKYQEEHQANISPIVKARNTVFWAVLPIIPINTGNLRIYIVKV